MSSMLATSGDPRVITRSTRSGWRTASTRPNIPPRLCPMTETARPWRSLSSITVSSSSPIAFSEQPMLERIPEP